jgi:ATP-binding cassette subfamily B protein
VLQAGLLGLVLLEWRAGRASAGDAVFAITAFLLVSGYLRTLGENIQNLQKGIAEIEDVVAYAADAAGVEDRPDAPAFAPGAGAIAFDAVTFSYKNAAEPLYSDFSLEIAPGETVALVGPTGSGKSTFVRLVQRLYDVDTGAIRIDGQDVRDVTQTSLRRAIALVPQDPALFHRPLRENIAYARPDASLEEIIDAAKRARAHDFIAKLPLGYDTEVGERGVKLSGGERQRVALARAFLAGAPILILDEATSSLDVETERDVQAAMAELMEGRTTIVIAHRLSTVREADRILVFNQGRIVEQGKHAELIAARGLYARLNAMSRGDMLAEEAA